MPSSLSTPKKVEILNICGNLYFFPDDYYLVNVLNNMTVEIKNEKIHVNTLYHISRFDKVGNMELQYGFIDVYVFEYNELSYVIIRYVEENGNVVNKIIKSRCNSSDRVDITQYLPLP